MNTNEVIESIKEQLKPALDKWVVAQCERINGLREYKRSDEYNSIEAEIVDTGFGNKVRMTKGVCQFYHLQELGYSKKDMQNLGYHKDALPAIYQKEAAQKLLRVDVAVNKKLSKVSVKEIDQIGFRHGLDGFVEGDWIVTDDDGQQHKFKFETIFAGGYNIQCLHIRTKYTLKAVK